MKASPTRRVATVLWAAATVVLAVACGGADDAGGAADDDAAAGGGFAAGSAPEPEDGFVGDGCTGTVAPMESGKVDIVFVIDNSASMHEELVQIRENVNRFADRMTSAGLDFRVVFIVPKATNPRYSGICVPPPLGRADCGDNPPTFFHVDQNVGSWSSLDLILSTYDGASSPVTWKQYVRLDATKVFVVVTDDESWTSAESFDRSLRAKPPAGMFGTAQSRNYVFHSIVSKPASAKAPTTARCGTAAGTSVQYQKLSLLTGGIIEEVCKTDYTAVLDVLANGIADKVTCELAYPKSEATDPTKVVVRLTLEGSEATDLTRVTEASKCSQVDDGWYYDDPESPTKIVLCPSTCTTANETRGSRLESVVGCTAPPPR
jgi:hypothetical protein